MKILLTTDTYPGEICGVNVSIATLERELVNKGHDVRILMLSDSHKSKAYKNRYLIGSFSIHLIDFRQSFKFNDDLIDDIISWNPDIVHIQTEWFSSIMGKKIADKCNCPYLNTNHTYWEEFTKGFIPTKTLRELFAREILKKSYENSSWIISPSIKSYDFLKELGIDLPVSIIPTGVDLERFSETLNAHDEEILKSQLDLKSDSRVLVYVGRIAQEKNLEELLEYFADLILRENDLALVLVGDGPHIKQIKSKVKHLNIENHVRFAGFIQPREVHKYYHLADIFVSPATCETQGITYMEALAASLPLVCRNDKSLDGVIEEGYNGFTYESKEEFIESVIEILSNSKYYDELKDNAGKSSVRFSKEKFGQDVESVYLSIING